MQAKETKNTGSKLTKLRRIMRGALILVPYVAVLILVQLDSLSPAWLAWVQLLALLVFVSWGVINLRRWVRGEIKF